ncbi:MAG: polyprenyl synthetase family protein [Flavobacteriaceae bacterium]
MNYQKTFTSYLENQKINRQPENLYKPIEYILALGGKRIRPTLTLMGCDVFGENIEKALPAAMAVEVFHNFSLIHDDIMDKAPLRRGKQTVHEKWNLNTGILSGDAMLILAYRYFEEYEPEIFSQLAKLFSKTALEVCEGQQWDIDFENRNDVTIEEYLKMIEYKTAVLVGAAFQMGAIVAETSEKNKQDVYDFGLNLGIAFQLQDDYLDTFGNSETFGKQIGGDIIENKKTYLYLKAISDGNKDEKEQLLHLYSIALKENHDKIESVKSIFRSSKSDQKTKQAIEEYTQKAFDILENMDIPTDKKEQLKEFGEGLMNRIV